MRLIAPLLNLKPELWFGDLFANRAPLPYKTATPRRGGFSPSNYSQFKQFG